MEKTDKSDNMFKSGYAPYRSIGVSEEGELAYFWLSPGKRAYLSRGRHHPQLLGFSPAARRRNFIKCVLFLQ